MLNEQARNKIIEVLEDHGVRKASLFGSYARKESREGSDIDLLVDLPDHFSLLNVVGLKLELEEKTGKDVDLVEYSSIKENIKDKVLEDEEVIYES